MGVGSLIRKCGRAAVDTLVVPLVCYVSERVPASSLLRELERRAASECADYVSEAMPKALSFTRKKDLLSHALRQASGDGILAEFGVWKGRSINHIAREAAPRTVFGFDSFEGLREDWAGWSEPKGAFSLDGRAPSVGANVRLVKGWFDKTIPAFLAANPGAFSLVHVDSDTYEAATTVLNLAEGRIVPGTVIVFDEYFGYRGWRDGEFRAWQEFIRRSGSRYEYLAFTAQSVSVRVTKTPA